MTEKNYVDEIKNTTDKSYVYSIRNMFGNSGANTSSKKEKFIFVGPFRKKSLEGSCVENASTNHQTGPKENMFGQYLRNPFAKVNVGKFKKGWNRGFPNENSVKDLRGVETPADVSEKEAKYRTPANVGTEKSDVIKKVILHSKDGGILLSDEEETVKYRNRINYKPIVAIAVLLTTGMIGGGYLAGRNHGNAGTKVIERTYERIPAWAMLYPTSSKTIDTVVIKHEGKDNSANITITKNSNNTNSYNTGIDNYNKGLEGKTPAMPY